MATDRLLLVEDDPVSAAYLGGVLRTRGTVDAVTSLAGATDALRGARYAALVCDCRLPDGHASELPPRAAAVGLTLPPALALSAELDDDEISRLRGAGFTSMHAKPIAADILLAALDALVGGRPTIWDDRAAQRALGLAPEQRRQLRGLLLQELPAQRQRVVDALGVGDLPALHAELHRLKASCGLCGATALAAATAALSKAPSVATLAAFDTACEDVLAAGVDGRG